MADNGRIKGFKKFSQLKEKKDVEEIDLSDGNISKDDLPMNPNLPDNKTKKLKNASTKALKEPKSVEKEDKKAKKTKKANESVTRIGKIAKFPKNSKASTAYNYLEDVKISKRSIWYLMIEKQENELQMVKYNNKEGVNLAEFVNELKSYYISKYTDNEVVCEQINGISIGGNDKFATIGNIPLIEVDGKKIISKITEDLIRLLSK